MQTEECLTGECICIDPPIGVYRDDFIAGSLAEPQQQKFEDHLLFCLKCQDDVAYFWWIMTTLKTRHVARRDSPEERGSFREAPACPLPVHAVYDRKHLDLTADYFDAFRQKQFAAASTYAGSIAYPLTVEYANGEVIAQFRKRVDKLFFRLEKNTMKERSDNGILVHTSPVDPSLIKTFELHQGDDLCLGMFEEFVMSETIQGMLDALKQFQLFLKQPKS